ncbi:hypothetical protein GRAN_2590 [Granulicella sibirica]|uniref:DinB-like domain-containing protein n=2 Tax=Granulicella sibirica TaxID=2479048 RepID=A0A4Q0SX90_9BACT|nr:hypothetical protein GRAN_2590 [Granulicella sibirica]
MQEHLAGCLGRLNDEQIWEKHGPHENAIGNLVLHLCGNARQWIMHGIAGVPDVRVRDAEFQATGGKTREELLGLFAETMAEARSVISSVAPERLTQVIHPQDIDVTVLEAIYQVVGHVQQHIGQIVVLTKQMTGRDVDLVMPRAR